MANLLGQNIGTNYKGILNLNTLNGNLSGTLQAVTDGDGNASPLQLSTTQVKVVGTTGVNDLIITDANTYTVAFGSGGLGVCYLKGAASSILSLGSNNIEGARLDLSNNFIIGTTSASARLHVRGDGTNPIGRFESSVGNSFFIINNSGQSLFGSAGANEPYLVNYNGTSTESGSGQSLRIRQRANTGSTGNTLIQYWADGVFSGTTSGTAISHEFLSSGFLGSSAGSANYRNATFAYTINNSGAQTGTATGIFLNATETALNGMGHNLMDLQVGGSSKFKVNNSGTLITDGNIQINGGYLTFSSLSRLRSSVDGDIVLYNQAITGFNLLQLGGTTNAFPAIKRNSAAIDFRLADDTGFCNVRCNTLTPQYIDMNNTGIYNGEYFSLAFGAGSMGASGLFVGSGGLVASAILQANSTTKGFLPPRMTTTEKNAISTPATGLVLYDTTLNKLAVYTGSAWETITSI
jgi:hypothetical protein